MTRRGGRHEVGSNQYQSRGGATPVAARLPVPDLNDVDMEDIAFAFHPERQRWLDAGMDEATVREWWDMGVGFDVANAWRRSAFTPSMATPWLAHDVLLPTQAMYRTAVYIRDQSHYARDPMYPDHAMCKTAVFNDCVVLPKDPRNTHIGRSMSHGRTYVVRAANGQDQVKMLEGQQTVAAVLYVDPFTDEVPLPPFTPSEIGLVNRVIDAEFAAGNTSIPRRVVDSPIVSSLVMRDLYDAWGRYWTAHPAIDAIADPAKKSRQFAFEKLQVFNRNQLPVWDDPAA